MDEKLEAFKECVTLSDIFPASSVKMFPLSDTKINHANHMEVYIGKQCEGLFQQTVDTQSVVERLY